MKSFLLHIFQEVINTTSYHIAVLSEYRCQVKSMELSLNL